MAGGMQRYANWFRDHEGRAYPGAVVSVYTGGTSNLANIYSAAGDVAVPPAIPNPMTTGSDGYFAFAAPDGYYDIQATVGGGPTMLIPNLYFGTGDPAPGTIYADNVIFVPEGGVSSINVQDAIAELDDEKVTKNAPITAGTGSVISYDAKGLVTAGGPITASQVGNVPAGTIGSTNVQDAINELDGDITTLKSDLANTTTNTKGSALVGHNDALVYTAGTVGSFLNKFKDYASAAYGAGLSGFAYALAYGANTVGAAIKAVMDRATVIEAMAAGQCRFIFTNSTTCTLQRWNGKYLMINGVWRTIPSAGVTLSATGLTPSTLYYVYAYWTGTAIALEASATGHSTDSTTGVEIKTGDATRTLVGMVYPVTGPNFADSNAQRFVASWFNRRQRRCSSAFSTDRTCTTIAPSFSEINSEIAIKFLTWGDDIPTACFGRWMVNTSAVLAAVCIAYDSTSVSTFQTTFLYQTNAPHFPGAISAAFSAPAEGAHTVTLIGQVGSAATLTCTGGTTLTAMPTI